MSLESRNEARRYAWRIPSRTVPVRSRAESVANVVLMSTLDEAFGPQQPIEELANVDALSGDIPTSE